MSLTTAAYLRKRNSMFCDKGDVETKVTVSVEMGMRQTFRLNPSGKYKKDLIRFLLERLDPGENRFLLLYRDSGLKLYMCVPFKYFGNGCGAL